MKSKELLWDTLRATVKGDVRTGNLTRTIYATDASIYEVIPAGVVLPRDIADVVATVKACRVAGESVVARGAGTGLTGGAIGPGVPLDLSRYMNRIGKVDVAARTVEVEPGVVLDELNAHLAEHGLQFGVDVATGSRATIGGMIANNSCGAHSIVQGRTVDHVVELTVVLADGEVATFSRFASCEVASSSEVVRNIEGELARIRDTYESEIKDRFPKILRSNAGYGLDRLGPRCSTVSAVDVLCGSEGTLGIVVGAKLDLVEPPRCRALVVLHFAGLLEALGVVPVILRHRPAAIELVDKLVLDAGRVNAVLRTRCDFLQGDPLAILVVELTADTEAELESKIEKLLADREVSDATFASSTVREPHRQADVWNLRKSGLGLLMSKPGDEQPYAFIEDSAVDPRRLRDYIEQLLEILNREGVEAGFYAHASAGCLHIRPVLNLRRGTDVERMRRIAEAVADLALRFGGTITGEHGDGIVRSCWLEKMYGARIVEAFAEVKRLFDPDKVLNPHKIVDPWPMTEHLRYGAEFAAQAVKTHLDISRHGGLAGLANMCSGVGQCRQKGTGTMCPILSSHRR